ncbi:MAG: YaeQ family protein [Betaproteobacteria bacterium]|nr:YaeQ family protein [Betaproteobacteria bacterium]
MALKSTIYKASLQIANMDSHYYADHQLSIACHPSEILQRMMIRILVFALNAHEALYRTVGQQSQMKNQRGLRQPAQKSIWVGPPWPTESKPMQH